MELEPVRRFAVVHATSRPSDAPRHDLGPTRALLGYGPRDRWPEGLELSAEAGAAESPP